LFNVFIPQVQAGGSSSPGQVDPPRRRGVGLPMGHAYQPDVDTLGAEWYYDWKCTAEFLEDPRYIPMSWTGGQYLPMLPYSYSGYLLAFNEPDNDQQGNATPAQAAVATQHLQAKYPQAKLIVGGVSAYGGSWLQAYVTLLGSYRPAGWHVHAYTEYGATVAQLMAWFKYCRGICPGGALWVTEFADVGETDQTDALMQAVHDCPFINRYAWFASRLERSDWYVPKYWRLSNLINPDGSLTETGKLYTGARNELPF
jgi:hypothetical protein